MSEALRTKARAKRAVVIDGPWWEELGWLIIRCAGMGMVVRGVGICRAEGVRGFS